ncbi:MAG TPA: bifunctional oligoribonuclease/PAP phosphatase NrnA [Acidimicrobiia bacterium]|nr:bifunctional oligoribonuclease/PAP phosphatase NrnA [Acidimicrobiia bacterium]
MRRYESLEAAVEVIGHAKQLTMACHVGPDGDALGSMLGLAVAAADAGIEVFPSFGSPFELPDNFRYLPTDLLVPPDAVPSHPEVLIAFDTGALDRLGELGSLVKNSEKVVVIDHHVTNDGFGDVSLIEPGVSSTAELTLAVIRRLGWPVTPTVARCLLTGIVTDTGRFQYSNTRPPTFLAAAQLVAAGAEPDEIGRHMYEEVPFGYLKVASAVLGRTTLEAEVSFVWSVLYPEELEEAGIDRGDVDGLIDLIRLPREADVAALMKVVDESTTKGSLRSRGRVDVGAIAAELGGGGHHNASGFTFHGGPQEALAAVRERLPHD